MYSMYIYIYTHVYIEETEGLKLTLPWKLAAFTSQILTLQE